MTTITQAAVKAAKHYHSWGAFAAKRYALSRGVPAGILRLARQLEAVKEK